MTFDEFIEANAPTADRQTKAIARRAWDAASEQARPAAKKAAKRVSRTDGDG